jgi:ribose transport system ATP-binding protein
MSENEKHFLFERIKLLKNKNVSIIFVSHFLDEVIMTCDNILVLKDGVSEGIFRSNEISKEVLIHKMLGSENVDRISARKINARNEVVMEVRNISYKDKVKNVSFKLKKGEIVGVTGLLGSGKTELLRTIYGLEKPDEGEIFVFGKKQQGKNCKKSIRMGLGYITEDRKIEGIIPFSSVAKNITISNLRGVERGFSLLNLKKEKTVASEMIRNLNVRPNSTEIAIANLSGGNQQKVIIGRWLFANTPILILDECTRGIDVGAKFEIYRLLREETEKGKSVLFVSSELSEILEVPDRYMVLRNGEIIGEYKNGEINNEKELLNIMSS